MGISVLERAVGGGAVSDKTVSDLPKSEVEVLAVIEFKSTKIEFRARICTTNVASTNRIKKSDIFVSTRDFGIRLSSSQVQTSFF